MNVPYRYRGTALLTLLLLALPGAAWRLALHDTLTAWRECRRLERRLENLDAMPATPGSEFRPANGTPEAILSGGLLDTLRRMAPPSVTAAGYLPVVTLREEGIEVHTARVTLTGPFHDLLRTVEALERDLAACRLRTAEWQSVAQPRTRRPQLVLTLYIQQPIMQDTR